MEYYGPKKLEAKPEKNLDIKKPKKSGVLDVYFKKVLAAQKTILDDSPIVSTLNDELEVGDRFLLRKMYQKTFPDSETGVRQNWIMELNLADWDEGTSDVITVYSPKWYVTAFLREDDNGKIIQELDPIKIAEGFKTLWIYQGFQEKTSANGKKWRFYLINRVGTVDEDE